MNKKEIKFLLNDKTDWVNKKKSMWNLRKE